MRASDADRERAVDVLRSAAGDGRLTAEELDERLEAALSARTLGELAVVISDLPAQPGTAAPRAKDVVRIDQRGGSVQRTGRWVVPRRLELRTSWCDVTLDFTGEPLPPGPVEGGPGRDRTITDMAPRSRFTPDEARAAGERIGVDWGSAPFDLEQFRMGMDVELEHGTRDPQTNVTDDDVITTAKIARAHLNEFPDYYTRLAKMEAEAEADGTAGSE
jgi:hypothetical protein